MYILQLLQKKAKIINTILFNKHYNKENFIIKIYLLFICLNLNKFK